MKKMKKILLPIDDSELSHQSFAFAKEMAENLKSKLVIVYVIEPLIYIPSYNLAYGQSNMPNDNDLEKGALEILEKAKSSFDDTGIEVETKILWGSPGEEIIEYAENENFDLIIMNTHGMSASKRFVIGSVANKVVKYASIPVMVVR